jgi:hypothetical protein
LLGLFFDPEDGGDMFLQNVYQLSTNYTALYPGRYNTALRTSNPKSYSCKYCHYLGWGNKNAECSLKRNWMKSVLVLNILLENPLEALQR